MSQIADLIQKRQAAVAEEQKRKEAETAAFFEAAIRCVEEALGDYRDEFVPFWHAEDHGGNQKVGAHLPGYMSWRIEHPEYGVLRLFVIVGATNRDGMWVPSVDAAHLYVQVHPVISGGSGRVCLNNATATADFFIGRSEATQKEKAEARQKKIRELSRPFAVHASQYDREAVGDIVGELLQLDPDNTEKHRQAYIEWLKLKDEADALEAEMSTVKAKAEKEQQKRQQAEKVYWDALLKWDTESGVIHETNRKTLARLQLSYDQVFPLYELAYALTGRDGDENAFAEVGTVYVLEPSPREGDWWQVWDQGKQKVTPMQFFTQVALVDRQRER